MTLDFVNQKTIDGITYTAYRDADDPTHTLIECQGVQVDADLKEVWNDPETLIALFQ